MSTKFGHNNPPRDWEINPAGWYAVSRDLHEHPIVGAGQPVKPADPSRGAYSRMEAWEDLLRRAQYKPARVVNRGRAMVLDVGQLMGARAFLAKVWNWSDKTVRGYLDVLERDGMISFGEGQQGDESETTEGQQFQQSRSNAVNVITVCNYSRYQLRVHAITEYVEGVKGPARGQQRASKRASSWASEGPAVAEQKGQQFNEESSLLSVPYGDARLPEGQQLAVGADATRASEGPAVPQEKGQTLTTNKGSNPEEESHPITTAGAERRGSDERAASSDRGTRLQDDWFLPKSWGEWALENFSVDAATVKDRALQFKNYWTSKSGKDATKKNWYRTWQNWCMASKGWRRKLEAADIAPDLLDVASSHDVSLAGGKLTLVNGKRVEWLGKFGDDEAYLDASLVEAAAGIQYNSDVPIIDQVERHLSRVLRWRMDDDRRHQERTKAMGKAKPSLDVSNARAVDGLERMKRLRGLDSSGDEPW
jgi:hypothetical protein